MVSRNLKTKYRRSLLGIVWTLLAPIAMAFVYYFVFKVILQVKVPHYLAFVLSGVIPWTFFVQTVSEGMESIVGSWGLVSKVPIPLQIFPLVNALTNFSTLSLAFPVLIAAAVATDVPLGFSLLLLPGFMFCLFLITYSLALVLGILFVYFRDLRHAIGILLQFWFYSTPVLYDEAMVPEHLRFLLLFNPLASIFTSFHKILSRGAVPSERDIVVSLGWTSIIFLGSLLFQRRYSSNVIEAI